MANFCVWKKPADWGGTDAQWVSSSGLVLNGIPNPAQFVVSVRTAAASTGYYFDADTAAISCSSFPTAGGAPDPLISQAAAIAALQAQATGLQAQVTAIAPWTGASTSEAQQAYFGDVNEMWYLFFGVCILIMCARKVSDFFDRAAHHD